MHPSQAWGRNGVTADRACFSLQFGASHQTGEKRWSRGRCARGGGRCAPMAPSATLVVNDTQAASGRLGVLLGLSSGSSFKAGTGSVVSVSFRATVPGPAKCPLSFTDLPVRRQVCDANASILDTSYAGSTAWVDPRPALSISARQDEALICWPAWATSSRGPNHQFFGMDQCACVPGGDEWYKPNLCRLGGAG